MDSFLDWAAVCLPTILSVVATMLAFKVPDAKHHTLWYIGLIAFGVVVSAVTYFQQASSRSAHKKELTALNGQMGGLKDDLTKLKGSLEVETARRQQSERDTQGFIAAVGKMTRQGVAEDIKNSPIRVQVNGQPTRDPKEIKRVRDRLGEYLLAGIRLRNSCQIAPTSETLLSDAQRWNDDVQKFLSENLGASFVSQFLMMHSHIGGAPNGVPSQLAILWHQLDQRSEALNRFIDQLNQP